ncbi:hypothetical protein ACN38_g5741 [Penicillium nordicum]|uniref:Uncharacterized protein n=1 Tax=Penicillium nordicum TaxID=229535 RepID=A0A0M8P9A8_9EURO|nr:hypothetical protein ACN38_g5741 [Penicillium nordicum]
MTGGMDWIHTYLAGHQSGGVEKSAIFSPNEVYFISPTSPNNHFLNYLDQNKIYFILSSTMNGHAACPKCGAAADGAGKSCGACGATCPV